MMVIANKMRIHVEKLEDVTVVQKILQSMMAKFNYIVCSIEESKDIDTLSIDELQSSLLVHEQKINQHDKEEQALQAIIPQGAGLGKGSEGPQRRGVFLNPLEDMPRLTPDRGDGWSEIDMGGFFNKNGDDGMVVSTLFDFDQFNIKRGFIIEGIEFRPRNG
ncbi:hypothetical protein LWI28_025118 [Acer negundo]|uniref:Retrovirus-related Pol polyprotein from transposon TNT 1-94 n=1 Tax=Acer negundo TaxID=4023 RepID=A0AAD5JNR3_ACENE|nr:hypothetical protein LWI28_025118 [Acer negundo]